MRGREGELSMRIHNISKENENGGLIWGQCRALSFGKTTTCSQKPYSTTINWNGFISQVVRGTLKTNKIISKLIPGILPECTFCNLRTKSILHLLWQSQVTNTFINDVYALFINKWKEIRSIPDMKSFCVGY